MVKTAKRNKGWFTLIVFIGFIVIAYFGYLGAYKKDKKGELPRIHQAAQRALKRYSKQRTPAPQLETGLSVQKIAEEHLRRADMMSSAYNYALAGQLFITEGDLISAFTALNKAIATNPRIDAPHILLAEAYYNLAMFDMFDRGLYNINLVQIKNIPEESLKRGYLRIEVLELVASSGRPEIYSKILLSKGLDINSCLSISFYLLLLRKDVLIDGSEEQLKKVLRELGYPKFIPVISFEPDTNAKEILVLAENELKIAAVKTPMDIPPGAMGVIEEYLYEALTKRIGSLMAYK